MTIEQIDSSKVLIVLGSKDMRDFALEYRTMSFEDPHSRKILGSILSLACTKTGISAKGRRMTVEALPHPDGCLILLTLEDSRKRRVYKIKRRTQAVCAVFENAENLIRAASALGGGGKAPDSSLYYYRDKYCLIFDSLYIPHCVMNILGEFSQRIIPGSVTAARVRENGKEIIDSDAHNRIREYFLN